MTIQSEAESRDLSKALNLTMLISIGLGGTIGTPIFTIIGSAAEMAGPAIVVSFLIGGGLTLLIGMTYSELSSAFPESGGGYTFAKKAFGGMPAFLTGWLMVFSFAVYGGLSALGFAYVLEYLVDMPALGVVGVALASLVAFTLLNIWGVRETGLVQTLLIIILVGGIFLFVLVSAFFISPSNLTPFAPTGLGGVIQATAFVYVAYFGFETIATVSGESAEPRKHLAKSTMISIVVCTIVYTLVGLVAVGVVGVSSLAGSSTPLMLVAGVSMGLFGGPAMVFLGVIATLTSLNASVVAASRTLYALSNDGLLPGPLATIGAFKTPHFAVIAGSALMGIFISLGALDYVAHVADFNLFLALSLISFSFIVLRRKRAVLHRPYTASPWAAVVSIIALSGLLLFLDRSAIATGIAIVLLGVLVYLQRITPLKSRAYLFGGMSFGASLVMLAGVAINRWSFIVASGGVQVEVGPVIGLASALGFIAAVLFIVPLTSPFEKTPIVGLTVTPMVRAAFIVERAIGFSILAAAAFSLVLFYADFYNLVLLNTTQPEGVRFLFGLCFVSFSFAELVCGFSLLRRRYVYSS